MNTSDGPVPKPSPALAFQSVIDNSPFFRFVSLTCNDRRHVHADDIWIQWDRRITEAHIHRSIDGWHDAFVGWELKS